MLAIGETSGVYAALLVAILIFVLKAISILFWSASLCSCFFFSFFFRFKDYFDIVVGFGLLCSVYVRPRLSLFTVIWTKTDESRLFYRENRRNAAEVVKMHGARLFHAHNSA